MILGSPLTPASDVYSLGILLYELVAGRPPFDGSDDAELLHRHVEEAPPPLSQHREELIPGGPLEQFLDRCLEKDPARRPPNMVTFLNELDGVARRTAIARSGDEQLCGDLRPHRGPPRNQRVTRPLSP
jgi:serine/threonine-protein kinase